MNKERDRIIDEIITNLKSLLGKEGNEYALQENIKFFRSLYTPSSYIKWLLSERPKIKAERLLELSDFGLLKWENELQSALLRIEQWKFPDILGPLKKEIYRSIMESDADPIFILNLGSGSMEVERKTILRLKRENFTKRIVFIGLDRSKASLGIAKKNLSDLPIVRFEHRFSDLDSLDILGSSNEQFSVVFCEGEVFELEKVVNFPRQHLIFYSKLKHHLPRDQWPRFENMLLARADKIVEWDDYNGWYLPILSPLSNWNSPVLLNGAIFSSLRDPSLSELRNTKLPWRVKVFPFTGYLKTYHHVNPGRK